MPVAEAVTSPFAERKATLPDVRPRRHVLPSHVILPRMNAEREKPELGMSERQKMLAGEPYLGFDPELVVLRAAARDRLADYNTTRQADADRRRKLLETLLGGCGRDAWIEPPFFCDYGTHTFLGDRVYLNTGCCFLDCAHIRVGDDVFFAPNVQVYTAAHPVDAAERIKGPEFALPVTIGPRCWIGGGAILLPGVTIGENTTIGAGSVVTKSVPANVVAAGNPCRVIRRLD